MSKPQPIPPTAIKSHRRRWIFVLLTVALGNVLAVALVEGTFRLLEARAQRQTRIQGAHWVNHPRWGWKPAPGDYLHRTPEFTAEGRINRHFMNDREEDATTDAQKTRMLCLGDSHTFAWGVSTTQTWVRRIESALNAQAGSDVFRTYNAAVTGYSLHQYLLRLQDDGPRLKPHYVVVGLSYATDFYDLLPPGRGGWIYGGERERDYFDLDDQDKLVAKHWASTRHAADGPVTRKQTSAMSARQFLGHSAAFRYLRRSSLMLSLGSRVRIGGQSLWPNMEVVMEKEISPAHEYQHRLFKALLQGLKAETERQGARLLVVGIPYLPQVYDELRQATFAGERYDPEATTRRVTRYCADLGISFVDAQAPMRERHHQTGRWLHFRDDAHPTAEGHQVIADAVVHANLFRPTIVVDRP